MRTRRNHLLVTSTVIAAFAGLGLSVTAFGQDTSTAPLSDYTTTVPTATAPSVTPTMPKAAPKSTPAPRSAVSPSKASATAPALSAPTQAKDASLAFTGFDVLPVLLAGLALTGLGATLLVRRTRTR